jgi:hypothetical protein
MSGVALLLSVALLDAGPPASIAWAERGETFADLQAFHVRVDVHPARDGAARTSRDALRQQIEAVLGEAGIPVVATLDESRSGPHGLGFLVLDVHELTVDQGTAVAWTLHASQIVRLMNGAATFASTWEVGDLVQGPVDRVPTLVRDSLGPGLSEFTTAYRASRPRPRDPAPAVPPGSRAPAVSPEGTSL